MTVQREADGAQVSDGGAELVCCVRVPDAGGAKRRLQEVSTHSTMIRSLADLANHLVDLRIERVVMEATSDYWRLVFYRLEAHGLEPWLVNARIKLSVVASDIYGVSGRQMMAALIVGERDPKVLADMARTRMRAKIPQLVEAFTGHFDDHHRFLLAQMLRPHR